MVSTAITSLADPPADAHDAYLRLHLLSHRLVQPRSINLDGIFASLANVVWTSAGPCAVADFETRAAERHELERASARGLVATPSDFGATTKRLP